MSHSNNRAPGQPAEAPVVFKHLTGLTVAVFDELAAQVVPAVEHGLARLRQFRAATDVNRHRRKGHADRVRACAGLVNRMPDHQNDS
ncbi:MAG: hypothetical protein K2V38_23305 [Gemmataceae bacterium]|nr:hypothetical protein [Gemmataceae bacterium]